MKKHEKYRAPLSSSAAFFIGAGSVLNISGKGFSAEYKKIMNTSDVEAIKNDWVLVGQDISKAAKKFTQNNTNKNTAI